MKFSRKSVFIAVAVILLLIFTIWIYPELIDLLQVDACLDEGGKWNQEQGLCEHG